MPWLDNSNAILLNRFFSRSTFRQLIDEGEDTAYTATIRRYIQDYPGKTNKECISEIYRYLKTSYQNEYYYKNTLLNKLLLGVHSPHTTTALTEVPIGTSKADFILINGKAIVYEIKTSLDNMNRLSSQIKNYYKAFSRVTVVTSETHYEEVQHTLANSPVGIYLLTKKGTLSIRQKPIEYCDMLSKTAMFKILRKHEYEQIIYGYFKSLPDVSQFEYYRTCQTLFETLPTDIAHKLFTQSLKRRNKINIIEYSTIPYELKFLVYFSNYTRYDYKKLCHFLDT